MPRIKIYLIWHSRISQLITHQIFRSSAIDLNMNASRAWIFPSKKWGVSEWYTTIFRATHAVENISRVTNTIASICSENMLAYLSLHIICSSKLPIFSKLPSRKTFFFSAQIMPTNKYTSIFTCTCKMEAIFLYLFTLMLPIPQRIHPYEIKVHYTLRSSFSKVVPKVSQSSV